MKKFLVLLLALVMCVCAFAACGGEETPEVTYKLDKAVAYVKSLYIGEQVKPEGSDVASATKYADFERVSSVPIAGVIYDVEWSVDVTDETKVKVVQGSGTTATKIDVNERTTEDITFVLTATVKAGDGTSDTLSFNFVVPAYNPITFDEYMAAKEGDQVTVEGIVVAINSKAAGNSRNHLFLADASGKGGYYSYQMDQDPVKDLGIEVGMTVAVSGPVTPYSGMQEIKGGTARILDTNKKTVDVLDITEQFKSGADLKNYVGLPVTIKGVEIGGQELATATSQYLFFSLNGKEGYVRTYVTDFPTTLEIVTNDDSTVSSADKTYIDELHASKFGWTANATGILILYNSNPYLIPMSRDCFEYIELVEKTADEKIEVELGALKLPAIVNKDGDLELPMTGTAYSDVKLAWASNNDAAVIGEGKVTFTIPNTATDIKLTVTATCGEATKTKEFSIKLTKQLDPNTFVTIPEANTMASAQAHNTYTEGKYFVTGVVESIANATYGNMYIKDAEGNTLYIYGLYNVDGKVRFDAMETKPAVGDTITVYGALGQFNNSPQMKNAWLVTVPAEGSELSLIAANVIGLAQGHNKYTAGKYVVAGVIESIASDKYGNMTIKDADGNTFYLYGLYSADGSVRYDAMETKPAVGDTITVTAILGQYNGQAQFKNAWMTAHTAGTPEVTPPTGGEGGEVTPPAASGSASVSFADTANRTVMTDDQQVWVQNGVTVTNNKAESTQPVKDYSNPVRFYANTSLTISVATGKITKIVIECSSDSYANALMESLTTGCTATVSGTTVTIELATPVESFTIAKIIKQFRVNTITVYAA